MIYSIGSQFSREFSFQESSITLNLTKSLNNYFEDKNYGHRIKKIYIGVICVSENFEHFFPIRPLKILKKEPALEFELKLDFAEMYNTDENTRMKILSLEILNSTKKVLKEKTINGFDKEKFIEDFETYFKKTVLGERGLPISDENEKQHRNDE